MEKKYKLSHLDCASCASSLESDINKLGGVKKAEVNFSTLNLKVEFDGDERALFSQIKKLAKDSEGIVVYEADNINKAKSPLELVLFDIFRIALALIIYITATAFIKNDKVRLAFYLLSYAVAAYKVLIKAVINTVKGKRIDEIFLMAVASIGAIAISKYAEAVEVMIFYELGEVFQSLAVNHSRNSITALMDIKAEFARVLDGGEEILMPPEEVEKGSIILVKAGEKVALDGIITKGSTSFDTRSVSGESVPKFLEEGGEVTAGSVNLSGVVEIKTTADYADSSVSKILNLLENSAEKKSKQEGYITKLAKKYTPTVCILAVLIALVPPLFDSMQFSKWLYTGLIFLVVSCPCALLISVPLSFFSGLGISAKHGVLVKGGNYFEDLSKIKIAVFDKTGTLTDGNFTIKKAVAEKEFSKIMPAYAAAVTKMSNHPLSRAIASEYDTELAATDVLEIAGYGLSATVGGITVLCGSEKFLKDENIEFEPSKEKGAKVYVAIGGKYGGCFIIEDNIRPSAYLAVKNLKKMGVKRIIMLTGDNAEYAQITAQKLGIKEVYSQLLPHEKVEIVERLKLSGEKLLFVGDGINDAPVLSYSDIGVSLGGVASDAAVEAADMIIINQDLNKIPLGMKFARKTISIVKQNIALALSVKAAILVLGVLGMATMRMAVFVDVGVMLIAIFNSLRNFIVSKSLG